MSELPSDGRLRILPVVGVVVLVAGRGVDVVSNQPVEVLVGTDPDVLHVLLGDVPTVGIKVPQDHHVLESAYVRKAERVNCVMLPSGNLTF